jgi:hypothetical protein
MNEITGTVVGACNSVCFVLLMHDHSHYSTHIMGNTYLGTRADLPFVYQNIVMRAPHVPQKNQHSRT